MTEKTQDFVDKIMSGEHNNARDIFTDIMNRGGQMNDLELF